MNDIHSLAPGYVVDALDPDEVAAFEAHLATCHSCTRDVAEFRGVSASLAEQVAADPPASLRAGVLDAVARTPQLAPGPEAGSEPGRSDAVPPASVTPIEAGRRAERGTAAARSRRPSRWSIGLVAASLLAAVGLGGWAIQSRQDAENARRDSQVVAAQASQLARLLAADDVQLAHGQYADGGTGVVVMSASEGAAMLVGRDVAALPDDKVYEAWTIDGDPTPAGTFRPSAGESLLELPQAAFDADAIAVTIEAAGGSDVPTTDPVFAVDVPRA